MKVTNLMEDYVKTHVEDMYKRIKSENSFPVCDCENCQMDTLCYVLNRVPPKYTVSGRGINHARRELETIKQISADVDTIIMDGIRLISSSKRPNHNSAYASEIELSREKVPYFFFPILSGYVYDGTTFESLVNAEVTLLIEGKVAQMVDSTWQNPYKTFKAMEGGYNYCLNPLKAEKENETRTFNFEVQIKAEGYEPINYAFMVPVSSKILKTPNEIANYSLKIQDLFLFPAGSEAPMQRYPKPLE